MYSRILEKKLINLSQKYPVVTMTGPRQSGKTTLVKAAFPDMPYASLEAPDVLEHAGADPRGFLGQFKDGVILDEIQRLPELLSYIQTIVDEKHRNGMFILTGSQQLLMLDRVSQSLAGRTALLRLLPLSLEELSANNIMPGTPAETLLTGGYPRIYDQSLEPAEWHANYTATYVERDVRSIKNIGDLSLFTRFLRLCAGRSGQMLNMSEIGNECGITHNTVKSWLSVLEASSIVFLLQPHFKNFNKRVVKSPKLYFLDTGLLCYLLNLRSADAITVSPFKGHIFETFVVSEIVKHFCNRGEPAPVYFWRDKTGHEIDCLIDMNAELVPIEIKSGETIVPDFFKHITFWQKLSGESGRGFLVYGGESAQERGTVSVVPWREMERIFLRQ